MTPPAGNGSSDGFLDAGWYVVCESRDVGRKPVATTLMDRPLVLYRAGDGTVAALLDRCPHRNVPLSLGRVRGQELECAYHGWRFETGGECCFVPGLAEQTRSAARNVPAHAVRELDGFVWVWGRPDSPPDREPFRFPYLDEPGYTTVRRSVEAEAPVLDTAENALDVPHTAYLHGGLFRNANGPRNEIQVVVRRWSDRVEAEYIGEPRPTGLAARILAPGGGTVIHFDRYLLPSIVQVEYRLGDTTHFCVSAALTPLAPRHTRLWAAVSLRLPIPGGILKPLLHLGQPLALRIFQQDAEMLRHQSDNVRRFGGERYKSTEADVLGPQIQRLVRRALRGEDPDPDEPVERTFRMLT